MNAGILGWDGVRLRALTQPPQVACSILTPQSVHPQAPHYQHLNSTFKFLPLLMSLSFAALYTWLMWDHPMWTEYLWLMSLPSPREITVVWTTSLFSSSRNHSSNYCRLDRGNMIFKKTTEANSNTIDGLMYLSIMYTSICIYFKSHGHFLLHFFETFLQSRNLFCLCSNLENFQVDDADGNSWQFCVSNELPFSNEIAGKLFMHQQDLCSAE